MAMSLCCRRLLQSAPAVFVSVGVQVGVIVAAIAYGASEAAVDQGSEDASPLSFFRDTIRRDLAADLAAIRPRPVTGAAVRRVEALLPQRGELRPTQQETQKISAVRAILRFHDRDVIVIKVIDVPQAVVGLHARAILLLSRPALTLLDASELRAVAAHEIGHDFFWEEYLELRQHPDPPRRRRLELRCDGIAVATLTALGAPVGALKTALRKLVLFNERLGQLRDTDNYPALAERIRFMTELRRHIDSVGARTGNARASEENRFANHPTR